jgi:hypothetical protein
LREAHRDAKEQGAVPKHHPIMSVYKFCNVRREDDRVTKWIKDNIRVPFEHEPHLWFALTVARLFNNEDTLAEIKPFMLPFKPAKMMAALQARKRSGLKNFNAAYIVSTNGRSMDKIEYVVTHVLVPLWAKRAPIRASMSGATLAEIHGVLSAQNGLGSFMAGQIIADMKYAPPFFDWFLDIPTRTAPDWYTFAAPGPGSKRGLNKVMGRDKGAPYQTAAWLRDLEALHKALLPLLPAHLGSKLHFQDLQNCLCEFDKYERARTGDGRPKQYYQPKKEVA